MKITIAYNSIRRKDNYLLIESEINRNVDLIKLIQDFNTEVSKIRSIHIDNISVDEDAPKEILIRHYSDQNNTQAIDHLPLDYTQLNEIQKSTIISVLDQLQIKR